MKLKRSTLKAIKKEMKRAKKLHPVWPIDQVHQVAKIVEEAGEAIQAANSHLEIGASKAFIRIEIIECLGTCVRYLEENGG